MKKLIVIFTVMILLISCGNQNKDPKDTINPNPDKEIATVDLSSEEGIIEYLVGEWNYDHYYRGDIVGKMIIDENLNVELSFNNTYSDRPNGDYKGKITLERLYSKADDPPDIINLQLYDTDEPTGDFFFLHRTIYDGKRVMSWFFSENGNSIFDAEDDSGNFRMPIYEIIFEKITNEQSTANIEKDGVFYAVFWGMGPDKQSLWLDRVWWEVQDEDYKSDYPLRMTMYVPEISESVLYSVDSQMISEVLGDEMPRGEVYYIETNEKGEITYLIDANRREWMTQTDGNNKLETMVYEIMKSHEEINEYLLMGMTIEFENNIITINDEMYYEVILGTLHDDYFVRELFFGINVYSYEVLRYDAIDNNWKAVIKN